MKPQICSWFSRFRCINTVLWQNWFKMLDNISPSNIISISQVYYRDGKYCVFSLLWIEVLLCEFDFPFLAFREDELTLSKLKFDQWVIKSFWVAKSASIQVNDSITRTLTRTLNFAQKNHLVFILVLRPIEMLCFIFNWMDSCQIPDCHKFFFLMKRRSKPQMLLAA